MKTKKGYISLEIEDTQDGTNHILAASRQRIAALRCGVTHKPLSDGITAGFQTTLDLFSMGVELMRQNLRRADPEASADEIDGRLQNWLQERPGAEFGDCTGRRRDVTSVP